MKTALIAILLLALATAAVLGFRGRISSRPPVQPWEDMNHQPKYRPQSHSAFFADGRSDRPPPAGTIAWGRYATKEADPQFLVNDRDGYAAQHFPPEVKIDLKFLQHGQSLYDNNCRVCHGGTGAGNGITTQYGMNPPPSYHQERLRNVHNGYIYQVITQGKGQMGPYAANIKPADRWAIVAYVRALQRSHTGKLSEVPESRRQELDR